MSDILFKNATIYPVTGSKKLNSDLPFISIQSGMCSGSGLFFEQDENIANEMIRHTHIGYFMYIFIFLLNFLFLNK